MSTQWNWKRWLAAFVAIVMAGCLTVIVWVVLQLRDYEPETARSYHPFRTDSYEISAIESNADITLPPSARDIYASTTGFHDIFIKVRFSMSVDELDEFLKSTLCQEPLRQMRPGLQSTSDDNPHWWIPDQAMQLEGCTGSQDHSHQTIIIDMSDPDVYAVFVSTATY